MKGCDTASTSGTNERTDGWMDGPPLDTVVALKTWKVHVDSELARVELAPAAALFRSLGDPTRQPILRRLAGDGAVVVDLVERVGLAQSTGSKHLACLRDCGLVGSTPSGRASVFALAQQAVIDAALRALSRRMTSRLQCRHSTRGRTEFDEAVPAVRFHGQMAIPASAETSTLKTA
jgi:ArsR family transcriptional regulator, cadmium/lead-responsive transcriptional repressor